MNRCIQATSALLCAFLLYACDSSESAQRAKVEKFSKGDPFATTMVKSQFFDLQIEEDLVVEGKEGVVVSIPKDAFLDANGKVVEGNVQLELAEAMDLYSMLTSNLTTTANGQPLQTAGMIYINATKDGQQLQFNPKSPLYIELPTANKIPGMLLYRGERDSLGNMNWIDPQPLQNFLIPIDIELLDFLPNGFEAEVAAALPFRKHTNLSDDLVDSLYYALSTYDPSPSLEAILFVEGEGEISNADSTGYSLAIDPAILKSIQDEKFNNTLLATREFENRLQEIFKTCDNRVIQFYIDNLDKNLYEIDSMVADYLGSKELSASFADFAALRSTVVEKTNPAVGSLQKYYQQRLRKTKSELKKAREEYESELKQKEKKLNKTIKKYTKLLYKREKERLEAYGFRVMGPGYYNVDVPLPAEYYGPDLELQLVDLDSFDRSFAYVVYASIENITAMNMGGDGLFRMTPLRTQRDRKLIEQDLSFIAIAYKEDSIYFGVQEYQPGEYKNYVLQTSKVSATLLKDLLSTYSFNKANNPLVDLQYRNYFADEAKRLDRLEEENFTMMKLASRAFPCVDPFVKGEALFAENCSSCHQLGKKAIGPDLQNVSDRHSIAWLVPWTMNSYALVQSGDKKARHLFQEYNGSICPSQNMSVQDVQSIFAFIERQ